MRLGLGLYRHMLTAENFRFARQAGATHIVAHWVDYFHDSPKIPATDGDKCWGISDNRGRLWSEAELRAVKAAINAEGLELHAIENFDPSHWYDILLDGPRRDEQVEDVKQLIRTLGRVGIPVMGYNFSIAGVWGHVVGPWARGGAESVAFFGPDGPAEKPIPSGQIWNMIYDPEAAPGEIPPITHQQLWDRLARFLKDVVPVAEEAGVRLAAHPDDPPMPTIRGHARLVYQPHLYQKLLDLVPSPSNCMEFCQGTIAEMQGAEMDGGDVYDAIDHYSRTGRIAYVHLRNIKGKVPRYTEVFLDEGDVDIVRALKIYKANGYDGVVIPDHTPQMACDAPWHAGMAFALGYIRGILNSI
ncbi:MAG: mannonate dehydratase [Acidobacteria bacterium]|nr:mannonate dehydratase [Acidobacteriota bacterium]